MADYTTNVDTISSGMVQPEVPANQFFDAASKSLLFGRRGSLTSGLTWAYFGGKICVGGVITSISNGTVTLTTNSTNYVEATTGGTVSANTTGFTAGRIPLYQITVSSGGLVTDYTDKRLGIFTPNPPGRSAKSISSDANYTLTQAESYAEILAITSGVSLTATRNIVLPVVDGMRYAVYNGTTGAQSLQFIGATGTGITVANGKRARIYCDGTNWVRETADV